MRRRRPDLHLLHAESFLEFAISDGDGDEEDADDDVECGVVWTSPEWDAVGGGGVGVWRGGSGGGDSEEGEGGEGEGEGEEGAVRL